MQWLARTLHTAMGRLMAVLEQHMDGDEPAAFQTFHYVKPGPEMQGAKEFVLLGRTEHIRGAVHVLRDGGGESLHSHKTIDGFWMVLSGKARFHGDHGPVGVFGPMQGIVTPRNTRYWFESADGEDLELLQVLSFDARRGWHRDNHAPPAHRADSVRKYDGRHGNRAY